MGIPLESAKSSSDDYFDEPRLPNTAGKSRKTKSDLAKSINQSSKTNFEEHKFSVAYKEEEQRNDSFTDSLKNPSKKTLEEVTLPEFTKKKPKVRNSSTSKQRKSSRQLNDSIGHYLSTIGKVALLSQEEEITLAKQVQALKNLIKSVLQNSDVPNELTQKYNLDFLEEKPNEISEDLELNDKEINDEEIIDGTANPNDLKNELDSSIFAGKEKFSNIASKGQKSGKELIRDPIVKYVKEYFINNNMLDKKKQLERGMRARKRYLAANLRLVVSVA